jgi:UDP-N-acetylglucosamine 3-dehydrogenase
MKFCPCRYILTFIKISLIQSKLGKVNIGIIGLGVMGKNHARVYSKISEVNLVAICDLDKNSTELTAKQYGASQYTDYKEMLDKENLDAVSICLPTKSHLDASLYAIKKKKHILIEKPIASTLEQSNVIVDSAKEFNVKVMVGHVERFNPVVQEIKRRLLRNELGKIFLIKAERFSPFPKRVLDVGVTIDLSVHDIDIMHYLLEDSVISAQSVISQKIHSNNEDLMAAILRFKNGSIGSLSCNWITPKIVRELTLIGEKGMFKADYLTQSLIFCKNEFTDKYINWEKRILTVTKGDEINLPIKKYEPLKAELESFISCIQDDIAPTVTGQQGIENLKVALQLLAPKN